MSLLRTASFYLAIALMATSFLSIWICLLSMIYRLIRA